MTDKLIELLKESWKQDPVWNIEDSGGFEDHYDELKTWRLEYEAEKEAEWQERLEKRRQHVMDITGISALDHDVLDSLSTWSDISDQVSQCASSTEDPQVNMTALLVRTNLLQAAQLKRIADVLETMQDSDSLNQSVRIWGSGDS
jgi:hypothetical protein